MEELFKRMLDVVFKYVKDGKQVYLNKKKTGYSFRSIDLKGLIADKDFKAICEENAKKGLLNIRHGFKGDEWTEVINGRTITNPVTTTYVHIGKDTRTEYASSDELLKSLPMV
jgi:hypothetical protein